MTADRYASIGIKPAAMDAWRALTAALAGRDVPCRGRDEWTSDDPEEREWAAGHCLGCLAIDVCGRFADANKERYGVFGGRDYTSTAGRPAKRKESA